MTSGGHALQHGGLPGGHHHVAGRLPEIVSEDCRKMERRGEIKLGCDTLSVSPQFKQWLETGAADRWTATNDRYNQNKIRFCFFCFLQGCFPPFTRKSYPMGVGASELMARKQLCVCSCVSKSEKKKMKIKSKSLAKSNVLVPLLMFFQNRVPICLCLPCRSR